MKTKNLCATTLVWAIALGVLTSCNRSDFTSFVRRDASYHARLAAACDEILAKGPVTGAADSRAFAKDTNSLPQVVRELHPSHIEIRANSVLLSVGTYFVLWKPSDQDQRVWVLTAYRDGHERQVYKRNK
jgi:hypothetical protein